MAAVDVVVGGDDADVDDDVHHRHRRRLTWMPMLPSIGMRCSMLPV